MIDAIKDSSVITGYTPYLDYIEEYLDGKELISTGMKSEIERCEAAIEAVKNSKTTAIISTGDAGLYGMAGPIFEFAPEDMDIEVVQVSAQTLQPLLNLVRQLYTTLSPSA